MSKQRKLGDQSVRLCTLATNGQSPPLLRTMIIDDERYSHARWTGSYLSDSVARVFGKIFRTCRPTS